MADIQPSPEGLAAKTIRGSAYSIAASAVTLVLGVGRSILMARLLSPEDFGVVAFALTFLNITIPLRDFGLDQALIHHKSDRESPLDQTLAVHFSLRLIFSGLFVLILLIAIPALRHLYPQRPLLVPVLLALTAGKVASALGATPTAYLRKEMRFEELAVLKVLTSLSMTVVGPLMAWHGWGVWAIVGEQISGLMVATSVVWVFIRPWRLRWDFDWALVRWYLNYGKFIFVTHSLNKVINEFDDFWVGAALGSQSLGFYSKAYELANYPRRVVSEPLMQVLFPAFAKVQDDRLRLSKAYYRASSLIIRVGFLAGGALVLGAYEFVLIFLKSQWIPMVFTLQLMVVFVLLEPLREVSSNLVNAVGHPEFYTRARVAQSILSIPLVILGTYWWGIQGVAVAVDLVLFVGLFIILCQVRSVVQISFSRMLLYPIIALSAGLYLGWQIAGLMPNIPSLQLAAKTLGFGVAYSLVLVLSEGKEYTAYVKLFKQLLRGPFKRSWRCR